MSYPNQTHIVNNFRQIQNILDRIAVEAGTEGVFLVDESGFLIAEAGDISIDRIALSALLAASFGATEEVAKLLGENGFAELIHQGDKRHLFICKAGQRHIVISIFDGKTNLGLVKLYVERAVVHLSAILDYQPPELKRIIKSDEITHEALAEETEDEVAVGTLEDEYNDSESDSVLEDDVNVNSETDEQTLESNITDTDDDTITDVLESAEDDNDQEEEPERESVNFDDSDEAETTIEVENKETEELELQMNEFDTTVEDSETEIGLVVAEESALDDDNGLEEELDDIDDDILKLRQDLKSELSQMRVESEQLENESADIPSDEEQESETEDDKTDENDDQEKRKDDEEPDIPAWLEE